MPLNRRSSPVAVFGEVLFDHFPDGFKTLGGAPFNVAWNLAALDVHPVFVSAVGDDIEAKEILEAMRNWGLATHGVAVHPKLPTGSVTVTIENGEPEYEIVDDQAYDQIQLDPRENEHQHLLSNTAIVYHGSLALRHRNNRIALKQLTSAASGFRFVDLNIREPWFDSTNLHEIVGGATWLKLSQHELETISGQKITTATVDEVQAAIDRFESAVDYKPPQNYLVTSGSEGAFWISQQEALFQPVAPISNFVDAVGAGDAFAAAAIDGIVRLLPPRQVLERAVSFASKACTIRGATTSDRAHYRILEMTRF